MQGGYSGGAGAVGAGAGGGGGGGYGGGGGGMPGGGNRQIYVSNVCPFPLLFPILATSSVQLWLLTLLIASIYRGLARSQGPVSPGRLVFLFRSY